MNPLNREVLLAFWKVHALLHASEGPLYGQWLLGELRRHGYDASPGTVYPLLARLERHGWLRALSRAGGPRARRDYVLTNRGRATLATVRARLAELASEMGIGPPAPSGRSAPTRRPG